MQPGYQLRTISKWSPLHILCPKYCNLIKYLLSTGPMCPSNHDLPFSCPSPLPNQAPPHNHQHSQQTMLIHSNNTSCNITLCIMSHGHYAGIMQMLCRHYTDITWMLRQCYMNVTPGLCELTPQVTQTHNRLYHVPGA